MTETLRSADMLVQSVLSNPTLVTQLQTDPVKTLNDAANQAKDMTPVYRSDVWVYRMVVGFLGAAVVLVILSYAVYPVMHVQAAPEGLVAIGAAAVGALAGLLAPSPAG